MDSLKSTIPSVRSSSKSKKRPCCVCKSTKRFRDNCFMNNDETICFNFIKAH